MRRASQAARAATATTGTVSTRASAAVAPTPPRSCWFMMTTAKVSVSGPYKIVDMVSSWKARTNTSPAAVIAATASGGSTTVRAAAAGPAPLSRAARVRPGGSRSRAAWTGR